VIDFKGIFIFRFFSLIFWLISENDINQFDINQFKNDINQFENDIIQCNINQLFLLKWLQNDIIQL
jgi:hypothetical protein